ncbi:MAG: hypothetical protein WCI34_02740 [Actinomycetes bacterium]
MPLLTSLGLISLALGGASGWLVVAATQNANWFRSRGVPVPHRFLQMHIDWLMMGLILIAIQAVAPGMPNWIRGLVAFGSMVNPVLFFPLAWGEKVSEHPVYKGIALISFSTISIGLPALAIWALTN